ncbi:hypothetical protein [Erwinia mallotivora]|uniref:hypothetical protein n=1 Tax=Erwinia mallotivora TaxID=69222 RepID=UPI0021BF73F8|nr:hypothetical protein [Erwinia mallotivora]
MYKKTEKLKNNKNIAHADYVSQKKSSVSQKSFLVDNRSENIAKENTFQFKKSILPVGAERSKVVQRNKNEHGLVPPTTHNRSEEFQSPADPKTTTKGHHHAVPRKQLTRFERMIDRIGRVLATSTNVHVAVALDDNTLVISANKESADDGKKLENVAVKLKDLVNNNDVLDGEMRINGPRRYKDLKKMNLLLNGKYTDEKHGIEANEEVSDQLLRLIKALNGPVLKEESYKQGISGIYIVPTSLHEGDRSYNMHGELKVSEAIRKSRMVRNYKEKQVYIGGTLSDCFACNASHKLMNEKILGQIKSFDWRFYSGGTHGGVFPGYKLSDVASDNKARFNSLTGIAVHGKDKPYLSDHIPSGSEDSLNYDSESDAEDVEELTAYAKARKSYVEIRRSVKKSMNALLLIEENINKMGIESERLQQELKKLQKIDTDAGVNKASQEIKQNEMEREVIIKTLESIKIEIEKYEKELTETEAKVREHPEIKIKERKGKIKSGIKIKFDRGRILHDTAFVSETQEQRKLNDLDVTKRYSEIYQGKSALVSNFNQEELRLSVIKEKASQLESNLENAKNQAALKNKLPEIIKNKISDIERLHIDKTIQKETIAKNEEEEKNARSTLNEAANQPKVEAVKTKQDFLNYKEIIKDQSN